VGINANYSSDAANAQTLVAHMAANRAMLMPGDTFGLTSGSNICLGLCGETFGQLIFRGMKPNGDPYNNPWIAGGTVYKGVMACLGLAAQTETIYNSPNNYTTQDIFNQANLVGYTHFMIGFAQNASPQSANWIGSAPNMATWNSAPGTFGGGLDTEKNNTLSNSTRPSNMP
jgi:hypothetical protein